MLGGMQRTLSGLIMKFANRYLDKIDSDLNLSLWSGDVVLKRVELRLDVLQRLIGYDQQLRIDYAVIGELQIHIPWTSITTKSVEITLSKLQIKLSIDPELSKPKEEPESQIELSNDAIDADFIEIEGSDNNNRLFNQEYESSSWTKSLLERIVANAVVNVEDFSLAVSNPDLGCVHISFGSANVQSTNSEWEAVQVDPPPAPWRLTHYLISMSTVEISLQDERRQNKPSNATQKILRDLDLDIRIRMYRTPSIRVIRRNAITGPITKSGPKLQADMLVLSPVEISISAEQMQLFLQMSASIRMKSSKNSFDVAPAALTAFMGIAATANEPRSNSWGSWAWDILAAPPGDNALVDISENMPSNTMTLSIQAPSVIVHFYSLSFMFCTLQARYLCISALKEVSQQRLSLSFQSLNFVDQSTLLPFCIIAEDADCKQFMPFLNFDDPTAGFSETFRKSLEKHGFDTDVVLARERVQEYSNFCLYVFTNGQQQCTSVFIRSVSMLLNLKSSSSVLLFEHLFKFISPKSTNKESIQSIPKVDTISDVFLGRFSLTVHIDDMADWRDDELYSDLNSFSFQMAGVSIEHGPRNRKVFCSSIALRVLALTLKAQIFRETSSSSLFDCFSSTNFLCEMAPKTNGYSVSFRDMQFVLSLNYIYLLVFAAAALSDFLEHISSINELRSTSLQLRPTKALCFFDAMFANAVLSLKIFRLTASGAFPDTHKFTVLKSVINISRKGQTRCLLSTEISPFLDIEISAKRDVSICVSPAKLIWDSAFHDFFGIFQIYRRALQAKILANDIASTSNTADKVRWKPSSLAVKSSPIIVFVPLQDPFHIRRLPMFFGYRSSPSLSFHLPSVTISPLSLSITNFSITDSDGSILLAPLSADAIITSSLSQASIDVSRIIMSMDTTQANAFKLALMSLAPVSS